MKMSFSSGEKGFSPLFLTQNLEYSFLECESFKFAKYLNSYPSIFR